MTFSCKTRGFCTLFLANGLISRLVIRFPKLARLFEGTPAVLIENGKILTRNLRREVMSRDELERAIRKHGLDPQADMPLIKKALLEQDGTVTIISKNRTEQGRSE